MHKILNNLDPLAEQTKADLDHLAVQMVNVNQGITNLQTRMQGIEKKQDKKDLDNLSTANTAPLKTKLENTQDRQGELQQLIKHTQSTIIDFLHNSKYCKSFHEFTRKLNETFSWDVVNEYDEQYHKISSL